MSRRVNPRRIERSTYTDRMMRPKAAPTHCEGCGLPLDEKEREAIFARRPADAYWFCATCGQVAG